MNYILDVAIIAIIIGCAAAGSRKGAVRMLITIAGYILAVGTAIFVSNVASDYVYENHIKPSVISALEAKAENLEKEYLSQERLNSILEQKGIRLNGGQLASAEEKNELYTELLEDENFREDLNNMFTEYCEALTKTFSGIVPEEIIEEAERYLKENNMQTDRILTLITHDKTSVIKIIENEIIRPVMIKTVKFVLFAVTFVVVMIVVSIVSNAAKVIRKIPVVNSADSFLGTMLGVLQGLLYTIIANAFVSMFIKLTFDSNEFLNTTVITESHVFGLLYNATFYLFALILN